MSAPTLCDPINTGYQVFGIWYANLIRFSRVKCVLFTNEKTLYTFLVPNVLRKDLREVEKLFMVNLRRNLEYEGFTDSIIKQLEKGCSGGVAFAKTTNRGVIGSMVDLVSHYPFYIENLDDMNQVLGANSKINQTLMSYLKYDSPMEALQALVKC